MNLGLEGRVVLVTGGTRGIGEACARAFLDAGSEVIITGKKVRPGWWDEFASCRLLAADFSDPVEVDVLLGNLKGQAVEILINNSGAFLSSSLWDQSREQWRELMEVNVEVPMLLSKAVCSEMRQRKWGRIVNIGSIAGMVTRAGLSAYATSKAALAGMTRALALDLAADGVLVNCVCPAYTDTDMLRGLDDQAREALLSKVPLGKFATPGDIAAAVIFLASDQNRFITGQNLVVDGGVTIQ